MANFAAAVAANIAIVESLTATVQRFTAEPTAELPVINTQLITALSANTTLTVIVSAVSHNYPRGR